MRKLPIPSGHEAMCGGAAALLTKRGRPVGMRIAFVLGTAKPDQWDGFAHQGIN